MQSTRSAPREFTGTISLRLTDLIQMVCLSLSDLVIDVVSSRGRGSIHIRQGQIRHAQTDLLTGAEAFFEVLQWNDGQFEILPFENNVVDSVNKPWEHLLLEAIRLQDEKGIESDGGEDGAYHFKETCENPGPDILGEIDDVLGDLFEFDCHSDMLQQGESIHPQLPQPSLKVLIVEDSAFFSKRLRSMLEFDHAIKVVGIARNGKESLEFLKSGPPVDLVTLDINMPIMPGDTALKHIMIQYRTPVIIISSMQPDSMHKVFNFLQLGAVDYIDKPGIHDDLAAYGANLRKLVKGVAKARISNFKRVRIPNYSGEFPSVRTIGSAGRKILVIVGAEGAHMDWLRLPLRELCGNGAVIGLQKLEDGVAHQFARFIEDKTGIKTEYLAASHAIVPGKFFLADARYEAKFQLRPDKLIDADVIGSTALDWENGMELWLERLAEQIGDSMCIFFMSAAEPLPGPLLTKLLDYRVRQILAPPQSVVCSQMIDSIQPHAVHFPDLILHSSPGALTEVFKTL